MFGGYSWTYPKGHQDEGESPEQTALREVYEETGVKARITSKLPGTFEGTTSNTELFMMEIPEDRSEEEEEFFARPPLRNMGGNRNSNIGISWYKYRL